MSSSTAPGRASIVTGATSGIGRLIALHLAKHGTSVVGVGRSSAALAELEHEAAALDGDLLALSADVTDAAAVGAVFEDAERRHGPVDLVITCAGVADALGPFVDVDADAWWRDLTTDLHGTVVTMRAAARRMVDRGRGRIVTLYGNLGEHGEPNISAFASAKAAIARVTECVAGEVESSGVRVFCMHPGFVRTPMTERLAWGEAGTRHLPRFGQRAAANWGDGGDTLELVDAIAAGKADSLTGRVLSPNDDLALFTRQIQESPELRRLRLSRTVD